MNSAREVAPKIGINLPKPTPRMPGETQRSTLNPRNRCLRVVDTFRSR
jgi:hypothetical protein